MHVSWSHILPFTVRVSLGGGGFAVSRRPPNFNSRDQTPQEMVAHKTTRSRQSLAAKNILNKPSQENAFPALNPDGVPIISPTRLTVSLTRYWITPVGNTDWCGAAENHQASCQQEERPLQKLATRLPESFPSNAPATDRASFGLGFLLPPAFPPPKQIDCTLIVTVTRRPSRQKRPLNGE